MPIQFKKPDVYIDPGFPSTHPTSAATGHHTENPRNAPRHPEGEYDIAIQCAQCGATIENPDKQAGGVCWLCGGDNYRGEEVGI